MQFKEGQPQGMSSADLMRSFHESGWGRVDWKAQPTTNHEKTQSTFQVDARGVYNAGTGIASTIGTRKIETSKDLFDSGIFIHPKVVEATWGQEVAEQFEQVTAARISGREIPVFEPPASGANTK